MQPLEDISVLELSTMIAGPYAGQMLGDLGADVVKIERPGSGELARDLEPKISEESFYYLTANRNKRSLALDITADEGREAFLELAETVDVVLENFQSGFTERYGIDYDSVSERNEDVIYCSISAYGDTGPYRTHPGIDTTIQAMSGAMSMARTHDTKPMRSGSPMNDVFASLYATQGILTAIIQRQQTGEGEFIDISLLDAGIAGLTTRAMYSLVTEEPYPPFGRRHNYFAPEGTYEVADGDVQLSVVTDRHWSWFCEAIDAPELEAKEQYAAVNDRVDNRHQLDEEIEERFKEWTVDELVETLREAGIPASGIETTLSIWENPHVQARNMRQSIEHPTEGEIDTLGFPVKYDSITPTIRTPPPSLGEHSEEIFSKLGYSEKEINALRNDGIISTHDT